MTREQRISRIEHTCSECGAIIPKNCEYIFLKIRRGSKHVQIYRHKHCDAIIDSVSDYLSSDDKIFKGKEKNEICMKICRHICDSERSKLCVKQKNTYWCKKFCEYVLHPRFWSMADQSIKESGGYRIE